MGTKKDPMNGRGAVSNTQRQNNHRLMSCRVPLVSRVCDRQRQVHYKPPSLLKQVALCCAQEADCQFYEGVYSVCTTCAGPVTPGHFRTAIRSTQGGGRSQVYISHLSRIPSSRPKLATRGSFSQ